MRIRGFTLVEVVVALLVFAVGMLALQRAAFVVLRQAHAARQQALAATIASTHLEQLAWRPCAAVTSGSDEERGFRIEWNRVGAASAGHSVLVSQTVRFERAGHETRDAYRGAVRCRAD